MKEGAGRISSRFMAVFSGVLNFFYPPYCAVCGKFMEDPSRLICDQCWDGFPAFGELPVQVPSSQAVISSVIVGFLGEGDLDDPMNTIIHEFKYFRRKAHARGLASGIATLIASAHWMKRIDTIVPVPLHPSKQRSRGYNQSQLVADQLGNLFGLPVVSEVLVRIRATRTQTRLTAEQRRRNVAGAFKVKDRAPLEQKRVLLIDDVVTTGATLNECAKTLLKAGAHSVHAAAAVHFQHMLP
jgi:competence protein ComFC